MYTPHSILHPPDMDHTVADDLDLIPTQTTRLRRPQSMSERNENHRRVAVSVASTLARRLDKQLHFLDSEIFSWPAIGVKRPTRRYCPVFNYWGSPLKALCTLGLPCA